MLARIFTPRRIIFALLVVVLILSSVSIEKANADASAPILVIVNSSYSSNRFGNYLGEILRAEGLNTYVTMELSGVSLADLQSHTLTILAETTINSTQATMFSAYVNGGGRLLAMRPDSQIASLFGLGSKVGTVSDRYVKFNNGTTWNGEAPAGGLTTSVMQTHGSSDRYNVLGGAVTIADLYTNRTTSDGYPAVVGSSDGRAVAFTYDLAKSIVYTRQGNPLSVDQDIDHDSAQRTIDLFQNPGGGTWVDLELLPIPQADEQQRLFARLVELMVSSTEPMPQLWYFPNGKKTMMIITADAHGNPSDWFQTEINSLSAYNAKATFYLSIAGEPTNAQVASWTSQGHTFGLHPYANLEDDYYPSKNLTEGYNNWDYWFSVQFPSTPKSNTVRNHMIWWEGWTSAAEIAVAHDIHMDTDFYVWGQWLQKTNGSWAHGYSTGSGQPMKFISSNGVVIDNYQQLTQLVDEQLMSNAGNGWEQLNSTEGFAVSKSLIDASQAGDYAAIMTQFHVDYYSGESADWAERTMAYAQSLSIPMWNADTWLHYTEARHDAEFNAITWNAGARTLSFTLAANGGAQQNLTLMFPSSYNEAALASVSIDGQNTSFSLQTIKGRSEAFVNTTAVDHAIIVTYAGGSVTNANLALSKSATTGPILAGTDLTYTLTVQNLGPSDASNVVLVDNLPNGVTYKSVTQGSWICTTPTSSQVRCTLSSLGLTSSSVTIVATINPETRGNVVNQASVSSSTNDPVTSNNTAQVTTSVSTQADLELTKSASSSTPNVGSDETFTLTLTNKGPSQATGVRVNDLLSNGYQYKGVVLSQGSYNQGTGEWNAGSLNVNQSATMQLTGTVKSSGNYDNYTQVVASNEPDPDSTPNDNSTNQDDDDTITGITPVYQANLSLAKTTSTNTPYAGDTVVFTLTLHNAGPSSSDSVTVKDLLPTSVYTFTQATPSQGTYDAGTGIWNVGSISAGVNQTLQLSVMVKNEGNASNVAEVWTSDAPDPNSTPGNGNPSEDDYATVSLNVIPSADLRIVKSGGATATAGQQVSYNLSVTNLGPSTASNVLVTDTLPAGMSVAVVTTTEWSCTNNSQTVSCSKASVAKGTTPVITVTVNIATNTLGNVVNRSRVSSATGDRVPANNTSNVTTYVSWQADLALSKTANPTAIAGQPLTYTLTVTNNGPSNSSGVVVTDTLPTGLTYVSNNLGWTCTLKAGNKVQCLGGDLAYGATKNLTLVTNVGSTVRGQVTNQAVVASASQDSNAGNNSASAQTNVAGMADLAVGKVVSKNNPDIFSTVIFTVTVTNNGPSQATGVQVEDALPSGYTNVVASPKQGSYANGTWNVGAIAVGGNAKLVISADVVPSGSYNNTAHVSQANESDPVSTNNSITVSVSPVLADLSLTQTVPTLRPGLDTEVVITLKVLNSGPNSASGIQVQDNLPTGLSFVSSNGGYDHNTGIWTVGTLQSGQEAILSITVRVDQAGVMSNIAQLLTSDQYDPDSIPGNGVSSEDDYAAIDLTGVHLIYLPALVKAP